MKAKLLEASGPLRERALAWWSNAGMGGTVEKIFVKGDGYLCFQYSNNVGYGKYHVGIEQMLDATKPSPLTAAQ
jgi:hypothetical protein